MVNILISLNVLYLMSIKHSEFLVILLKMSASKHSPSLHVTSPFTVHIFAFLNLYILFVFVFVYFNVCICTLLSFIKCQQLPGKVCVSPIVSGKKQNANSKDRGESGDAEKKYNLLKHKYKHGCKYKYIQSICHQFSAEKDKIFWPYICWLCRLCQ